MPRVRQVLGARCEHVGEDAPPSEIQSFRGNGNIYGSEVEVGGELKKGKKMISYVLWLKWGGHLSCRGSL